MVTVAFLCIKRRATGIPKRRKKRRKEEREEDERGEANEREEKMLNKIQHFWVRSCRHK